MKTAPDIWQNLAARARAARPPADDSTAPTAITAPPWFAARVTARWLAGDFAAAVSPWEIFALRSVALAAFVMLLALSANYEVVHEQFAQNLQPEDLLAEPYLEP